MVSGEVPALADPGEYHALLVTLVLLFSFKGEIIISNPLTILWIAIPLLVQTLLIFALGYFLLARWLKLESERESYLAVYSKG